MLTHDPDAAAVTSAQVHFALAADLAARLGRRLEVVLSDDRIDVTV